MDSHIQELQIPVIIWIGDKDEAVSPTGLQSLLEKANPSLVSFNILSGINIYLYIYIYIYTRFTS